MTKKTESAPTSDQPHRIRLPGFIVDEDVGLGDVIKRAATPLGSRPAPAANAGPTRSTAASSSPRRAK